ncbi:hypothetical protein ACOSQ3_023247 [Xanthoceras sorbifolium]
MSHDKYFIAGILKVAFFTKAGGGSSRNLETKYAPHRHALSLTRFTRRPSPLISSTLPPLLLLLSSYRRRSSSPSIAAAPGLFSSPPLLVSLDAAAHLLQSPALTWEGASGVQYRFSNQGTLYLQKLANY